MLPSKLGQALVVGTLALAAAPALAAEALPMDDTALGQVTAQGIGELAMLAWLPEPGGRLALLPPASTDDLILRLLRSDQSAMSIERPNESGSASRILQTAVIDLPPSQAKIGVTMQSASYQFGGQSATNLTVAATLNGMGNFGSIRP